MYVQALDNAHLYARVRRVSQPKAEIVSSKPSDGKNDVAEGKQNNPITDERSSTSSISERR